ncbi:LPS-assembly protein LptD [Novosphingobium album (ex Liu et al. 2023)]|uniref:LPS-assembly protein LptD n=1 Tax=Novosphingobium album (ex Liu et al. 2023) TaxID=3031130 RepID=A0ABT5WTQ2_9SPHN|nr:LPS assembly protein LptD [Novosphingobium album (ex Liu et al. 2023)]MDE8653256.1 LPS assembly protein LptD [Novosphingobium album (ex Liu et al. 2023)]
MLPAAPSSLQAFTGRLRPLSLGGLRLLSSGALSRGALAVALAFIALPAAAMAQDLAAPIGDPSPAIPPPPGPAGETAAGEIPIAFEADRIEYAEKTEDVTASGNVVLRRQGQSVAADTVTWNRTSGQIVATGNVRMVDEDGNQLFTERVELTDELKTGAMENLLIALRQGGRLAATRGQRMGDGNIVLTSAAYTGCEVEDAQGCPRKPSWRVTAQQVLYDDADKRISFRGARLVLFDTVALPLPGLRVTTDGRAVSGLLVPDFRFTPSNGVEISDSYYVRIAENRDLTATGYVYTKVAPMAQLQYRALTDKGAYQITGYATFSSRIPIVGSAPTAESDFRGYIFANGRLQLDPHWSVTGSIRRASDRTFLRRYDISRDDRLRSTVEVERIDQDSYLSIAGWTTQTMRVGVVQGAQPVALPAIDYRRRFDDPLLGGKIETQVNSLAILRNQGQDTQRAFARAQWTLRQITGLGQEVTLTGLLRGDLYHSDENELTSTEIYRGDKGWKTRGVATAALDVKWPFVGQVFGGTQVLTPRVQLVASPSIANLSVPNEDARAIELEDSNLFALNRFPGYDRIEDGVRFTYGLDWQFERPLWRIKTTIGQSIRLSDEPTLLPDGTGLTSKTSDIVGRTEVRYRNIVKLVHRFRLDKDGFAVRRNEFDAVVGNSGTYAEIGYTKLNRDISSAIEDLQDREEARFAGRVAFAKYWSLFGSAVVNLTDRKEDPTFGSDGFQPIRTRIGAAYEDDCLEIALTWRRDYVATGDVRKGNSFQIRFALRNLGFQ